MTQDWPSTTRRAYLALAGASMASLAGCGNEHSDPALPGTAPVGDSVHGTAAWPLPNGDPGNTRSVPAAATPEPPLSLDWTFSLTEYIGAPTPTVADGVVYTSNFDTMSYAVNAESGGEKWAVSGMPTATTPTVTDELAVVGGESEVAAYAVEDGEPQWRVDIPTTMSRHAGVQAVDGTAYAPHAWGLTALNLVSGEPRWTYETGFPTEAAPAVVDGSVYLASTDTYVHALDADTGERVWWAKTDGRITSAPVVADGTVYVGSRDNHLYAFDAETGEERWRTPLRGEPESLALAGGVVFVGLETALVAVNAADGRACWRSPRYYSGYSGGIAASTDYLYVPITTTEKRVTDGFGALDPRTGEVVWTHTIGATLGRVSSAATVANGAVYVGGMGLDGVLTARFS